MHEDILSLIVAADEAKAPVSVPGGYDAVDAVHACHVVPTSPTTAPAVLASLTLPHTKSKRADARSAIWSE